MFFNTKRMISITCSLFLLTLLAMQSPISNAQEGNTMELDTGTEFKLLNVNKVPKPKLTDETSKKARLESLMEEAHRIWAEEMDMSAVNNFLRENDCIILTPEKSDSIGTVSTSNSDVTMGLPSVGYETWSGYYFVTGTMQWKKIGTSTQPRWYNDFMGAGDAEVVLLSLGDGKNKNFKNKGYSLSIRDKSGVSSSIMNAEAWDNSGVIWRPQDSFSGSTTIGNANYNIDSYFATLYVEYLGSETNIPVFSQYSHTWKNTNITGFSFYSNGLSVSFADSAYGWKASSNPKYFN
ncbi:hypothetical protein [Bacillus sp. FJAT-26390]|uniref:hypothetical protein n=1 Tax=Bacillus sp. FJAT-26390 TaxID=1743142 RepID=UPI000807E971|nr:hypothetical protein [Bacillus sp. FJAT-26390]OBZ13790.1 hypothetical protein A7975_13375 [Bacillus sp. FJAT-26390]